MLVKVANIPLRCFGTAWIEIPDDTAPDKRGDAIAEALAGPLLPKGIELSSPETDDYAIEKGWEFDVTDERHGKDD